MSDAGTFQKRAIQHSLTCFLNSLLREWQGYSVRFESDQGQVVIPLLENKKLVLPLVKHSRLGRHQFEGSILLRTGNETDRHTRELSFEEFLDLSSQHLTREFNTDPREVETFKERVLNSSANIRQALSKGADKLRALYELDFNFIDTEQGLVIGHNFHPTPKSRGEFDGDDLLRYSPEFGGAFKLKWFMADPSILQQKSSLAFGDRPWTEELALTELPSSEAFRTLKAQGFVPIPMHPWQTGVLLKNRWVQELIEQKRFIPMEDGEFPWSATSSLRSIYRREAPFMLKFSMSVKLTNSVRHLLAHEVERGLQLHDVLSTEKGRELLASQPNFGVLAEPAYFCLKNADGTPMSESIVVCRENPFQDTNAKGKAVLATLTQDHPFEGPAQGRTLIQKCIERLPGGKEALTENSRRWFQAYLKAVIEPLMIAQANYGITLGAHQQNLILDINEGLPVGSHFRDCQGTGYSELGYSLFSEQVSSLDRANGNILSASMGNWLFSYYAILNSTFNVITAIASSNWISEEDLLSELKHCLESIRSSGVRDTACLDYLLSAEKLMHKGNFICSFRNMNENTSADPLALYTPVKNAIKEAAIIQDLGGPK